MNNKIQEGDSEFIPIWQYAKDNGLTRQTIYRLIRESKFKDEDVKITEKVVERILIKKDATRLPRKKLR